MRRFFSILTGLFLLASIQGQVVSSSVWFATNNEPYGSELAPNGEFDSDLTGWSGTNWAWNSGGDGGVALHTAGETGALYTDNLVGIAEDDVCLVVFTVGGMTASTVQATLGLTGEGIARSANGTYEEEITVGNSGTRLRFVPGSTFDGWVDAVSVKKKL